MKKFVAYAIFALVLIGCATKKKQVEQITPVPVTCVTVVGQVEGADPCAAAKLKGTDKPVQVCDKMIVENHCTVVPKK